MNKYKRILGGLIGGAAGDAMGAATESRTTEQIKEYFGHEVTDFEVTPSDTFAAGNKPGMVTDDFSSAFFVAKHTLDNGGVFRPDTVKKALVDWASHPVFFDRFAGPTTRTAIKAFNGEEIPVMKGVRVSSRQATNGAAMRISPVGLMHPGDLDAAIRDAAVVAMVTHNNYLAVSSACAVAAAVSRALTYDADTYNILEAGLYGAREGERIGLKEGRDIAGPSVIKRMEWAIEIGLGKGTPDEKMHEISDCIGAGLHACEAIPCAFGIFAAAMGDPMTAIIKSVNMGYDTDTIATMAGAIAGAYRGADAFPEHFLSTLISANGLDIEKLAMDINEFVNGGANNER